MSAASETLVRRGAGAGHHGGPRAAGVDDALSRSRRSTARCRVVTQRGIWSRHPCCMPPRDERLNQVFAARPFQVAQPEAANFLIFGFDANRFKSSARSLLSALKTTWETAEWLRLSPFPPPSRAEWLLEMHGHFVRRHRPEAYTFATQRANRIP